MCELSIVSLDHIEFYCTVDILGIKYKKDKKDDYIMDIKMNKHIEYQWIINDKMEMDKLLHDVSTC